MSTDPRLGDVLWFVRHLQRLNLSLALDARISVSSVSDGKYLTLAAGPESVWLPWRDGRLVLAGLPLAKGDGARSFPLDINRAGQLLQTTRRIDDAAAICRLEGFARSTLERPRAFVSYRWNEGGKLLPQVIERLENLGWSAWFDRWSGPRRLANGKEIAPDERILAMLGEAVRLCDRFVAVNTENYHASAWINAELDLARRYDKPVIWVPTKQVGQFSL